LAGRVASDSCQVLRVLFESRKKANNNFCGVTGSPMPAGSAAAARTPVNEFPLKISSFVFSQIFEVL
jgi:hypothetical protein